MGKRIAFSDDELLSHIIDRDRGDATYLIRNRISMDRCRKPLTSTVLRRLKRLEAAGRVERTKWSYATQICWRLPTPSLALPASAIEGGTEP